MGLKKGLPIPGKQRDVCKKVKCRRIRINVLTIFLKRTLWTWQDFEVVLFYCLGAAWRREKRCEDGGGSKGLLYHRVNAGDSTSILGGY